MSSTMAATPTLFGMPLKYVSLLTLTLQNSLLTILLHYSRTSKSSAPYSPYAAVLLNEMLKCAISFSVAVYKTYNVDRKDSSSQLGFEKKIRLSSSSHVSREWKVILIDFVRRSNSIKSQVFSSDCWKLSIPAILYVIQNNLQFVAASNLDVATFQVSYQLKILTTALCSVIMLKRRLSTSKWVSLVFLAMGVAIVQLQNVEDSNSSPKVAAHHVMSPTTGFTAVLAACFTSGLAGVYFEMVLKGSKADLWIRNIQLSLFSILPALLPTLLSYFSAILYPSLDADQQAAPAPALFANFGFWAWATVLCQVFGGLVTALVIKYSDNILKGFATSLSIVLSSISGIMLFDNTVTPGFLLGCITVLTATYIYNQPSSSQQQQNQTSVLPSASQSSSPTTSSSTNTIFNSGINVTNLLTKRSSLKEGKNSNPPTPQPLDGSPSQQQHQLQQQQQQYQNHHHQQQQQNQHMQLPNLVTANITSQSSVRRPVGEPSTPTSTSMSPLESSRLDMLEKGSMFPPQPSNH